MGDRTVGKQKLLCIVSRLKVVSLHCIDDLHLFFTFHWFDFNNYKENSPLPN